MSNIGSLTIYSHAIFHSTTIAHRTSCACFATLQVLKAYYCRRVYDRMYVMTMYTMNCFLRAPTCQVILHPFHHFSNGAPVVSGTLALAASRAATSSSFMRQPKPPAHAHTSCTSHALTWQSKLYMGSAQARQLAARPASLYPPAASVAWRAFLAPGIGTAPLQIVQLMAT